MELSATEPRTIHRALRVIGIGCGRKSLQSKGWRIHRIWSTNWFHARTQEIDQIKRVLVEQLDDDRQRDETVVTPKEDVLWWIHSPRKKENGKALIQEEQTLREALNRYWESNIAPESPDRRRSILSNAIINRIVALRPETRQEWQHIIPLELRQRVNLGKDNSWKISLK